MKRVFFIALFMVKFLYAAEIIVDNHDSGFSTTGSWSESGAPDEYADSSVFSRTIGSSATWTPVLPEADYYEVYVWYTGSTVYDRDTDASYTVNHAGGSTPIGIDQNQGSGDWVLLGTFSFNAGTSGNVTLVRDVETGGTSADAVRFVSQGGVPTNHAPVVNAGSDQTITLPAGASLNGTVTDDGLPAPYTVVWTQVSGPGTVTFSNAAAEDTTVSFSQDGTYVLRLSADDTELQGYDDIEITVNPAAGSGAIIVDNHDSGFSTTGSWSESGAPDEYADSSVFSRTIGSSATWTPVLPEADYYEVYVWYTGSTVYDRDTDASYTVNHAGGSTPIGIDQNQGSGDWVLLGTFSFNAGTSGNVTLVRDVETGGTSADAVRFVSQGGVPTNHAPVVNAGSDQTITLPAGASLNGTVTDDGLPAPYTVVWTQVSGPGTVTFSNAAAEDTTVSFSQDGTYVLRLSADDTELQGYDDIEITVNPAAGSGAIIVDNHDSGFSTTGSWSESGAPDEYADSSVFSRTIGSSATWTPVLPEADYYEVYVWYTGSTVYDRDTDASYTVNHAGGSTPIGIDQNQGSGDWVLLGTFSFNAGTSGNVTLVRDVETGGTSADAVRFVSLGGVPDTTFPIITIIGDNPLNLQLGDTFSDPGATAHDNIDGDVTASIQTSDDVNISVVGTYSVNYTVGDTAGNITTAVRTVVVSDPTADTTPPVVTIIGDNPLNLQLGDTFSDPGATAHDNIDGDVTASIQTSDDVDTSIVGTYSVTYTVGDTAGNIATAVRTVVVSDGDFQVIELNELEADTPRTEDDFGYDVAINGEYAVVGARLADVGGVGNVGAAYVYKKNINGHYIRIAELTSDDGAEGDYFGNSVAIEGDYVVVGAMGEDNNNSSASFDSGALYVFKKDASDNYTQIAKLVANDGAVYDHLGWVVDISGNYIVAGADNAYVGSSCCAGAAYVFKNDGLDHYTQVDKLTASDATAGDYFGYSVSVSGEYITVGAFYEHALGINNAGSAYIFKKDSAADTFNEVAKIHADDAEAGDLFGRSIDIDGDYVVVGAWYEDPNGVTNAGSAYVFKNDGGDSFNQVAKLSADDAGGNDQFGISVAIDGGYVIVGAHHANSAYLFQNDGTDNYLQMAKIDVSGGYFGKSVDISGMDIVVGANTAYPTSSPDAGSAYSFTILP
ncbi:immunoglobulin-like domain-containing protein [Sulfurimonas sp. HSL3-7]|uniref:golvesin C-terminal-like domain-containing protein n=1 Tax=Sulfonitrofixus jiaomeiensis TaxID=3131938 RepID=UPI0031F86DEC